MTTEPTFEEVFLQRNTELVLHELDLIFGPGNALSLQFKQTGQLPISMIVRALIRQQYFNKLRLEAIEEKMGITFDPKGVKS